MAWVGQWLGQIFCKLMWHTVDSRSSGKNDDQSTRDHDDRLVLLDQPDVIGRCSGLKEKLSPTQQEAVLSFPPKASGPLDKKGNTLSSLQPPLLRWPYCVRYGSTYDLYACVFPPCTDDCSCEKSVTLLIKRPTSRQLADTIAWKKLSACSH